MTASVPSSVPIPAGRTYLQSRLTLAQPCGEPKAFPPPVRRLRQRVGPVGHRVPSWHRVRAAQPEGRVGQPSIPQATGGIGGTKLNPPWTAAVAVHDAACHVTSPATAMVSASTAMRVNHNWFGAAALKSRRTWSSWAGRARPLPVRAALLAEHAPPPVGRTNPPHPPVTAAVPGCTDCISQQSVAELGIIVVGVEQRLRQIRLRPLPGGDRTGEPAVVGPPGEARCTSFQRRLTASQIRCHLFVQQSQT